MVVFHGLKNLTRFSGRDAPRHFWPYAGLVVAISTVVIVLAIMPTFATTFAKAQRFALEHPDQATISRSATSYSITLQGEGAIDIFPDMTSYFVVIGIGVASLIVLLAAAIVRRLHDRNRSGLWALPTAIFLGIGMVAFPRLWSQMLNEEMPIALFGLIFLNNLLYLGSLLLLIIQLAQPGTPGENRFGPPPK